MGDNNRPCPIEFVWGLNEIMHGEPERGTCHKETKHFFEPRDWYFFIFKKILA